MVIAAVSDDVNTRSSSPCRLAKPVPGRGVIYGDPQPAPPTPGCLDCEFNLGL